MKKRHINLLILLLIFILTSCNINKEDNNDIEIFDVIDLKEDLFIQGLESYDDKYLLCGLGKYEDSRIGLIEIKSGEFISKNEENEEISYFAKGPNNNIYQLTWKENTLLIRDGKTFKIIDKKEYNTEGWGIAYDKNEDIFYMTDGSEYVHIMNSETFNEIDKFSLPYTNLNELEYVDGKLYMNVWKEDFILEVDLKTRKIIKKYDLSNIVKKEKHSNADAVLNGISHIKGNEFYISGKYWDRIYKVTL